MSHILASLLLAAALAVGASTSGAAASSAAPSGTQVAQSQPQHAAGVVIDTGREVKRVCVRFSEASITGEELLRRANVQAVFSHDSMGAAVCSLCGVGCPANDCFCESYSSGVYWNYSTAQGPGWQRSPRGASSRTVRHGDVDGWAWGTGGATPPYAAFGSICEEVDAAPAPAPSPSPSPSPSPAGGTAAPPPSPQPTTEAPAPAPLPSPPPRSTGGGAAPPPAERDVAAAPAPAPEAEAAAADEPDPTPTDEPTADPTPTPTPEPEDPEPTAEPTPTPDPSPEPDDDPTESAPLEISSEPTGGMAAQLALFGLLTSGLTGAILWRRRRGPVPPLS